MTVFYNDTDYLDAAAANRARLNSSIKSPVVRDGRGWKAWSAPVIECKTSDGLSRIERYKATPRMQKDCLIPDRQLALSEIMKEHNLSVKDVSELLKCQPQMIRKWIAGKTAFSPKREFDLCRAIASSAPFARRSSNMKDKTAMFNVFYHGRQILSNVTAKKVKDYFDSRVSDRINIENRYGRWCFVYKQSRYSVECVFSQAEDVDLLLQTFISGAMRGLCAGYSFQIVK